MKHNIFSTLLLLFIFNGCAMNYMTQSISYPDGRHEKVIYTSVFYSDSEILSDNAEFALSVVNTRRVEPISYHLAGYLHALGPDDLQSRGTAVVHFQNDSDQNDRVILKKIRISNTDYIADMPEINLQPGGRFVTPRINVAIPTYDTHFNLELFYSLNGHDSSRVFLMKRQTVEDLKRLNLI